MTVSNSSRAVPALYVMDPTVLSLPMAALLIVAPEKLNVVAGGVSDGKQKSFSTNRSSFSVSART